MITVQIARSGLKGSFEQWPGLDSAILREIRGAQIVYQHDQSRIIHRYAERLCQT